MVLHNDSLIYYYHQGADSLTTGLIASCSKTFSAALMLRLVQEGTINLDDSIAHYYPFATSLGKGSMTLSNLFAHVSGLSGTTNYNSDASINLQQSADSILINDALSYVPIGTKFRYTGEDQQVAGAAAELAAGMSWDSLFEIKIAQPLGLDTTYFSLTTPTNPRVAGGLKTNSVDMLRFGGFILHNGKNKQGIQVVDSIYMQELWQDQTNRAFQISSPYPNSPQNNNPYSADTIYYGIGTWLDIYNPTHQYQEQISADGAFGGIIWINRCTNMVGVFLTFSPSFYSSTNPVEYQAMDIFRNAVPFTCYTITRVRENNNNNSMISIYPNPAIEKFTITVDSGNVNQIAVYNVLGEKVYFQKTGISSQSATLNIDLGSDFPAGIYFLQVNIGEQIINRKLVLEK